MTKTADTTSPTRIQEWILQTWRNYGGDIVIHNKKYWIKPGKTPDPVFTALMIITRKYKWADIKLGATA